jgi:4-hydroxybenzoate polyprenyltransferase
MKYFRLYRVKDWLHFLPLPLAAPAERLQLVGAVLAWGCGLAYTSCLNQAFDDRLDREGKNPVGSDFRRRQAVLLSLPPLALLLLLLLALSPSGLMAGAIMAAAATVYSAPPRLKRVPVVGTVWNLVIGVPGLFFAGQPRGMPLVVLFALLLLISQLLHEAQDRDDDAAGQIRTVATEAGRRAALAAALVLTLATPAAGWWLTGRLEETALCALFAAGWGAVLWRKLRCDDSALLMRLRLQYRWVAIALGAALFLVRS